MIELESFSGAFPLPNKLTSSILSF